MINIQATRGQLIGAAVALIIGVTGIRSSVCYVTSTYPATTDHSVTQAR
jgi:hypothetical protein